MTEHHHPRNHGFAKSALLAVTVFLIGCVILLWSWNTIAADLFQMPEARFKHAVAFGLLIGSAWLLRFFRRRRGHGGTVRS